MLGFTLLIVLRQFHFDVNTEAHYSSLFRNQKGDTRFLQSLNIDLYSILKVVFDIIEIVFNGKNLCWKYKFVCIFVTHLSLTTETRNCCVLRNYLWISVYHHKHFQHEFLISDEE